MRLRLCHGATVNGRRHAGRGSTLDVRSALPIFGHSASGDPIEPGHPLDTFRRENAALKRVITAMREIVGQVADLAPNADAKEIVFRLRQSADDLMDLDKHYQRKEHALFSCLESHGITGPSKVMCPRMTERETC